MSWNKESIVKFYASIPTFSAVSCQNETDPSVSCTKSLSITAIKKPSKKSAFICVIARSPADLIREGEALHHCVGRMNYDQRMVREESLIFFIRAKESPDIPLVTLEYSLQTHKILQCYGEYDHKPSEDILHYVNKVWLPYANKTIKKLAA